MMATRPTAAFETRTVYELFVSLNKLLARRMAMVVSHRFSSVRMACPIVVLRLRRVLEDRRPNTWTTWVLPRSRRR